MLLFGETLKTLRIERKITLAKMAKLLTISSTGYRNIEKELTVINMTRLFEMAGIFNVDPVEIINMARFGKDYIRTKQPLPNYDEKYLQLKAQTDKEIYQLQKRVIELHEMTPFKSK